MTRDISSPARAGASRPAIRPPSRARAFGRAAWRVAQRNPSLVFGGLAVAFGAGAFGWNVLVKQPGAHPAPLFASAKPAPVTVEPPRRPADLAAATAPRAESATAPANAPPKAEAPRTGGNDAIASLLRAGEPAPARPAPDAKTGSVTGQARVAHAQKALAKLGYGPIATDGIFGSTTRQALEKFERDRKIPVTGSLGPRTTRQLAALSGMPVP